MFNYSFKRLALLWSLLCVVAVLQAQIPAGYYSGAKGQKGKALKTALFNKITSHTQLSYKALWNAYKTTDVRSDGKIWDMYSDNTNYVPGGSAQGANYSKEGDSYNREHSFPKSWFNDATPMYTDLFHLYPTDGYVNNRRSNYPFGETEGETYTSHGGFSKLGKSTIAGYSGTVFEPNDEYKGDFARSYFYMATAYEDKIAGWHSDMLAGNSYPAYADWALTMLLRWAQEDPVSQKEIDRNNAVYKLQGNRNPYIDYPGLEQYVWGAKTSTAFDPDNYDNTPVDPTPDPKPDTVTVAAPIFSIPSGVVAKGTSITLSTETEGATLYYFVNEGEMHTAYMSATIAVNANTSIRAYAMLGQKKSDEVTAIYTLQPDAPMGDNVYTLITSDEALQSGQQLLIVSELKSKGVALSVASKDASYRTYANVDVIDGKITTEVGGSDQPYAVTLSGNVSAWTLYDAVTDAYLAIADDKNALNNAENASDKNAQWSIRISGDASAANIRNMQYTNRYLQFNASASRFSSYKSTSSQQPVYLYARATSTAIAAIKTDNKGRVNVYDINGRFVRRASSAIEALRNLPQGIYVVNGHKVLVR